MKAKPQGKIQKATDPSTRGHWNEMHRKQRREMMRKIQSEDLSLEVVHPHAAGIDIGNESHYVAVPPTCSFFNRAQTRQTARKRNVSKSSANLPQSRLYGQIGRRAPTQKMLLRNPA
jgi:hypothetical protein